MMQCPRCQYENSAGQKFCGECGARHTEPRKPAGLSTFPRNITWSIKTGTPRSNDRAQRWIG
jgi:zinc-ribbon domain